jgi:hypothetical protein
MRFLKHSKSILSVTCIVAVMLSTSVAGQGAAGVKSETSRQVKLKPQTTCPVQGDPIDKKLYVDYQDKRIYVCCSGCLDSVKANPQKYIDKLKSLGQDVETIKAVDQKGVKKSSADTSKVSEAGYWTCPMHPEIHQAAAGQCPICGMNLEFKKGEKTPPRTKTMSNCKMKM